jgi:hypothetical protein
LRIPGGPSLLSTFKGSLSTALASSFPEHDWKFWKFEQSPKGFWNKENNRRSCLDWLAEQLGIKTMEDWYQITVSEVKNKGGGKLLHYFGGSLYDALISTYSGNI